MDDDRKDSKPSQAGSPSNDGLLVSLSSVCRREIYEVASVETDEVHDKVPDPAHLPPTSRRILIRSIFAYIEAITFAIKNEAITVCSTPPNASEINLVKEENFELDDRGSMKKTRAKLRLIPNLRFAFRLYAKLNEFEYLLDCSSTGWQQLVSSAKVRDRLMHPKSLEDLAVTDAEIRAAMSAFLWFDLELIKLIQEHTKALHKQVETLKAMKRERAPHILPDPKAN